MELSLNIDENGRTISSSADICNPVALALNYTTQTMNIQIPELLYPQLLQDCENIVTHPSLPWTFWMPCDSKPRFALESLAMNIFHHHIPHNYKYDTATSGVEWWIQIRPTPPKIDRRCQPGDNTTSISFHWDKDEDLRVATGGLFIHPHLSTVTYLTSCGAPTVILNSKVGNIQTGEPNLHRHIDTAFISWPCRGKHLVFDGALLHGVPSELLLLLQDSSLPISNSSSTATPRVTFLVNIWLNYRPLAIQSFPLEDELLVHDLLLPIQEFQNISFSPNPTPTDEVVYNNIDLPHCEKFEWTLGGPVVIEANLPVERIRMQSKTGGNSMIEWKEMNGVEIVVKQETS